MKKITTLSLIASFLVSITSFADVTTIDEHHCITASIDKVQKFFSDYNSYSSLPGSTYSIMGIQAISMVKSQSSVASETSTSKEALAWIVLQPLNITDPTLYPRFLLKCNEKWNGTSSYIQQCDLQSDKQHFGLDTLSTTISGHSPDSSCSPNELGIQVHVVLNPNSSQVQQIKDAALAPAGILKPIIEKLFNEDSFFKSYFHNVYDSWINAL